VIQERRTNRGWQGFARHLLGVRGKTSCFEPESQTGDQSAHLRLVEVHPRGEEDARHLWPTLRRLIGECKPPVFFGEQVASKDTVGWLDDVGDEMENLGYAFGAAGLPACGVGLYQRRRRWYFVAYAKGVQTRTTQPSQRGEGVREAQQERDEPHRRVSVHAGWKDRVSEPGIPLVVDGFPGLVDAISGAGNAICPPLAVEFIKAADFLPHNID